MLKKVFYTILTTFICSMIFSSGLLAQKNNVSKEEVLKALNGGARYAIDAILDDEYKSRCDYNVTEGKWYDYETPWHTGQIIYGLLEAYKVTGNKEYLETAKKAGDWWSSLLITDHPKLNGMIRASHGDHAGDILVFATVSDGTAGMFLLHDITGVKKYADVPTSAGDWMMKNMFEPEHKIFYDIIDPASGEVMKENSPFWPDKKEQKLFDVARPNNEGSLFKDMYEYTGDEKYKEMFITLCESLLKYQGPEGAWMDFTPNDKAAGSLHPRFNLWYAESLLEGYDLTGDKRYLEGAKKTLKLYQKFQKKDGTIYYKNYLSGKSNRNSICGSAVSFAAMLWIRMVDYGVGDEFKENIEKSANWVVKNRFADNHPDKNLRGGFINTRTRRKKGKIWITQRDVGTAMGMRFLSAYYNYKFK
ncbi:MAG: beta-L-arabinofuranosidase domain-containing protein [Rhodothermaceae bacterium]